MLHDRRVSLRLTITQAARVLRLREQVLTALENGDFSMIPKSGYAQGIIASYARYLGLDPRIIIDQFIADLSAHSTPPSLPLDTKSERIPHNFPEQRPRSAARARQLGLDRSPRADRTASGSYPSQDADVTARMSRDAVRRGAIAASQRSYTDPRRVRASRSAATRPDRTYVGMAGYSGIDLQHAPYGRDEITTRHVNPQDYADDLLLDRQPYPYEPASTLSGRRGSRDIASTTRPNVHRPLRSAPQRRGTLSPRRSGIQGVIQAYFSDRRRTLVTIFVVLVIAIVLIILFAVKSCFGTHNVQKNKTVAVVTQQTQTAPAATSNPAAESAALSAAAARTAQAAQTEAQTETTVTVSLADGQVSWIEIQNDDAYVVANTLTGPWSKTFTVTKQCSLQVSNPRAITVTKNGQQVSFENNATSLGSMTIQGTQPPSAPSTPNTAQTTDKPLAGEAAKKTR